MVRDWESEWGRWRCDVVGVVDLFLGNIIFLFLILYSDSALHFCSGNGFDQRDVHTCWPPRLAL